MTAITKPQQSLLLWITAGVVERRDWCGNSGSGQSALFVNGVRTGDDLLRAVEALVDAGYLITAARPGGCRYVTTGLGEVAAKQAARAFNRGDLSPG